MKIERIHINNFRSLSEIDLVRLPNLAVFVGENGVGKSTLFQVFAFLKDALLNNVTVALQKRGGYRDVVTRGYDKSPILMEIQFRMKIADVDRLVTYHLEIENSEKGAVVSREILRYKRGSYGSPFHFLDFRNGEGYAISNEDDFSKQDKNLNKERQTLEAPNILAIKGLGQFQRFKAASAFRNLIENWHVSDFHIADARQRTTVGVDEHLSETGDNLPLVAQHLYENNAPTFQNILQNFSQRIPGMSNVTPHLTDDGYILLRFHDGSFKSPFIARDVSDGTIKMFAYLILLHDPKPHPFLCVEEPENQLYPALMELLVEELRAYARKGGQVFVSTHSPDFLNNVEIEEAFLMKKEGGKTCIYPLKENEQIKALYDEGEKLGYMWRHDMFGNMP